MTRRTWLRDARHRVCVAARGKRGARQSLGDRDTIKRLQTVVKAYPGRDYDLFGDDCAKFATRAWKAMTGEDKTGDDWWFSSPSDIMDRGSALIADKN